MVVCLESLSLVLTDRNNQIVRVWFRAPVDMKFLKFEIVNDASSVMQYRNVVLNLNDHNLSPLSESSYVNLASELVFDEMPSCPSPVCSSISDIGTLVGVPPDYSCSSILSDFSDWSDRESTITVVPTPAHEGVSPSIDSSASYLSMLSCTHISNLYDTADDICALNSKTSEEVPILDVSPPSSSLLLSRTCEKMAHKIFKKRDKRYQPRPVMQCIDMDFYNNFVINIDQLPIIPGDFCHSLRFWLCVKYIETMLVDKRAISYSRICCHFGITVRSVKRVVKYNLKYPDHVKTPVYYNLLSPNESKPYKCGKLISNFGRLYDIVRHIQRRY